jgi:membrane protease YdiL (CAAX protease family)
MGFFRRHQGRGSYDLFSNYAHYLPDVGGMCLLFVMFLIGALLGNIIVLALGMVSAEFAAIYGVVISYPVMFIPPLLYASAQSRRNEYFDLGYALDSNNFGRMGGWKLGLIVSIATIAAAFMTDSLTKIMPEAPQWFEDAMNSIMDAPTWLTLLSVSIFAPLFEEWLCRGLVLRGLLQKKSPAVAISLSALFFAVLHMNPWQAVPAFILGLLFGYVYYRTGSLKLIMLMH